MQIGSIIFTGPKIATIIKGNQGAPLLVIELTYSKKRQEQSALNDEGESIFDAHVEGATPARKSYTRSAFMRELGRESNAELLANR